MLINAFLTQFGTACKLSRKVRVSEWVGEYMCAKVQRVPGQWVSQLVSVSVSLNKSQSASRSVIVSWSVRTNHSLPASQPVSLCHLVWSSSCVVFLCVFFSHRQVTEWWLMDQMAWALVLLVFLPLQYGVKPFWPAVGFPVLHICVWTSAMWLGYIVLHKRRVVNYSIYLWWWGDPVWLAGCLNPLQTN